MKKAAKVFLIIGMVLTFYLIYPIVLGVITLDKLNKARSTEDIKAWGIISIFLVSTIGGVLILCLKDEDLEEPVSRLIDDSQKSLNNYDPSAKLTELKELKDDGIIDETTYQEKRKKYLEEL